MRPRQCGHKLERVLAEEAYGAVGAADEQVVGLGVHGVRVLDVQVDGAIERARLVELAEQAVGGDGVREVDAVGVRAAHDVAEVVALEVAEDGGAALERHSLHQRRHGQVPELDVAIAGGDEVGAVARKRQTLDLAGDLVGGDLEARAQIPHVDDHVVHGADAHDEIGAGARREAHALDAELVAGELAHLHLVAHVPHAHFGLVTALCTQSYIHHSRSTLFNILF